MLEVKTYKNFKVLREELGWKQYGGIAKMNQVKHLSKMCDWRKEGHKIIVEKVHNQNSEIIDGRTERSKFAKYVDTILTRKFTEVLEKNEGKVELETKRIISMLDIFKYSRGKFSIEKVKTDLEGGEISYKNAKIFENTINQKVYDITSKGVSSMIKKGVIEGEEIMIIINSEEEKNIAKGAELELIKHYEAEILKSLGKKKFDVLINKNVKENFYKELNKELKKFQYGNVKYITRGFNITAVNKPPKSYREVLEANKELVKNLKSWAVAKGDKMHNNALVLNNNVTFGRAPIPRDMACKSFCDDWNELIKSACVNI